MRNEFIGVSTNRIDVFHFKHQENEISKFTSFIQSINDLTQSGNYICFSSEDARTNVLHCKNPKLSLSIPSYRNHVVCSCVSDPFGLIVSGTDDGTLLISSVPSGQTGFVIDLNGLIPDKVIVTPSWGFIVVCGKKVYPTGNQFFLSLFSLNGIFIRQIRIESRVLFWRCFKSPDYFDYISVVLPGNNVFFFEVYYLNLGTAAFKLPSDSVCAVHYSFQSDVFIIVTENGLVHFAQRK
jgi:hypothetical protein